jgi:hypothetical protein
VSRRDFALGSPIETETGRGTVRGWTPSEVLVRFADGTERWLYHATVRAVCAPDEHDAGAYPHAALSPRDCPACP